MPLIARAQARLEAAEFERALALLEQAESGPQLSRADALRLLELRALGLLALNDERRAQRALIELAALDPEHRFAPGTSPDLLAAFERARTRVPPAPRVVIERSVRPGGVALQAHVLGDELGLVRTITLWTKVGDAAWQSSATERTELAAQPGQSVQYRATAQGLGGSELAATPEETWLHPTPERKRSAAASPWLYIGIAAGAVVIAGVTAALVVSSSSDADTTQPSAPHVVTRR